jgi:hypothetical protein
MPSKIDDLKAPLSGDVEELLFSEAPEITPEFIEFHLKKAHRIRSEYIFQMIKDAVLRLSQLSNKTTVTSHRLSECRR